MRTIVQRLKDQGSGDIYFWGSSMGGFGALLHGYLNRAKAVYANVPQTKLLGTAYSDFGMRKYFEKIFSGCNAEPSGRDRERFRRCLSDIQRSRSGKLGLLATSSPEHAQSGTNQAQYCWQTEAMLDENRTLGEGADCRIIRIAQKLDTHAFALAEPWNDLKKVIAEDVGCCYFLCFNQFEKNNYFVEHCLPFISHLNSIGAPFYLEVRPLDTHGKNHGINETILMFERFVR